MPSPKKPSSKLANLAVKQPIKKGPVWEGPESSGPQGGVTQSMLGRFLADRERFRVKVVEGLAAAEGFSPQLEFGNMWHVCEEHFAKGTGRIWANKLTEYCTGLTAKYRLQQEQIQHWYDICVALFPAYVDYWAAHPDVQARTPLLEEYEFKVPYILPSGRTVYLRGKMDSVDVIGTKQTWLQENKSKSSIDTTKLTRQLNFDLQTMMYLTVLHQLRQELALPAIHGVRYNVIRRAAHKSAESMMEKVGKDLAAGRGVEWFCRFNAEVPFAAVTRFRRECLDPILESLCDWWMWVTTSDNPFGTAATASGELGAGGGGLHWRHPYGTYNPLEMGGFGDVDGYLDTGSKVGLVEVEDLFPELNGAK